MSDTTPAGAPGLTRAEIGERLAPRAADTTPTAGQAMLTRWKAIERTPQYPLDFEAMVADIDAALAQARREGAEAMHEQPSAWPDDTDIEMCAYAHGMTEAVPAWLYAFARDLLSQSPATVRPLYDAPPDLARELAEVRAQLAAAEETLALVRSEVRSLRPAAHVLYRVATLLDSQGARASEGDGNADPS